MSWSVNIRMQLGALELDVSLAGDETPLAIIGPNGSGKTTLLRTIAGAYRAEAGSIRLGEEIAFDTEQGIDRPPEQRKVGYVPQGYGLFPHLSVLDNVAFGLMARRAEVEREQAHRAARVLLEQMGSEHLAERRPKMLSGGEQQRVALARALMTEPAMLLLDEPLSALDASARRSVRAYLAAHLEKRAAPTIVVTHDVRDVVALGASVVVLEAGKIVQKGQPQELAAEPATEFVAEFFATDTLAGPAGSQ